jgi:hypothetical protein
VAIRDENCFPGIPSADKNARQTVNRAKEGFPMGLKVKKNRADFKEKV